MDATARIVPARRARAAARHAARRRADALGEPSGQARPAARSATCSSTRRGVTSRRRPERRIADLLAEEEVAIAGVVETSPCVARGDGSRSCARASTTSPATSRRSGSTRSGSRRSSCRAPQIRLRGRLQRGEFQVRAYDLGGAVATADFAPVYPAGEELTPQRLRALVDQALPRDGRSAGSAAGRARPAPRAAAQGRRACTRCTGRARSTRRRRRAGGSRSRSCSCSRSASPAGGASARTRSRRRSARQAS